MAKIKYCPKCGSVLINNIENLNRVLRKLKEDDLFPDISYATEDNFNEVQERLINGLRPYGIYVFKDDPILLDGGLYDVNNELVIDDNEENLFDGVTLIHEDHITQIQQALNHVEQDTIDKFNNDPTIPIEERKDYWITEPTEFSSVIEEDNQGRNIFRVTPKHIKEIRDAIFKYTWQAYPKGYNYLPYTDLGNGDEIDFSTLLPAEPHIEYWISYDKAGNSIVYNEDTFSTYPQDNWTNALLDENVNNNDKIIFLKAIHLEEFRKFKRGYYRQSQWQESSNLIDSDGSDHDPVDWELRDLISIDFPVLYDDYKFDSPIYKIYAGQSSKNNCIIRPFLSGKFIDQGEFSFFPTPEDDTIITQLPAIWDYAQVNYNFDGYVKGTKQDIEIYQSASLTSNQDSYLDIPNGDFLDGFGAGFLIDFKNSGNGAGLRIMPGSNLKLSYTSSGTHSIDNSDFYEDWSMGYIRIVLQAKSYNFQHSLQRTFYIIENQSNNEDSENVIYITPGSASLLPANSNNLRLNLYSIISNYIQNHQDDKDWYLSGISVYSQIDGRKTIGRQLEAEISFNLTSFIACTHDILDPDVMNNLE